MWLVVLQTVAAIAGTPDTVPLVDGLRTSVQAVMPEFERLPKVRNANRRVISSRSLGISGGANERQVDSIFAELVGRDGASHSRHSTTPCTWSSCALADSEVAVVARMVSRTADAAEIEVMVRWPEWQRGRYGTGGVSYKVLLMRVGNQIQIVSVRPSMWT